MDRFVAMVWDQTDPSRQGQVNAWSETLQRQSPKWKRVLDQPGLRVFSYHHRGDGPVVTRWQGENGIVIGVLFERGQEKKGRVRSLDRCEAERVVSTRGDHLISNYWGNYLALWRNIESGQTTVLRDPCGGVRCHMTECGGVELLFAHADDVADFPGLNFTTDWNYLRAFIEYDFFISKHTGLNEVKELLAGERLEVRNREKNFSWAWNGAAIAAESNRQGFESAKEELRDTVTACFAAWGAEYRNIVVQMSGGLDSSILANLMRRVSDARITGMHHVGIGYEQKEVERARLAAAHAGIELVETPVDFQSEDMRRIFDAPRLTRPTRDVMFSQAKEPLDKLCARLGADVVMNGHGADNLLLQRGAANHLLADYVRLNGLGGDFWRTAYGAAVLRGISVWRVLRDVVDAEFFRIRWRPYDFLDMDVRNKHRPLTPDAVASIPEAYRLHPWIAAASSLPHGKADQLSHIVALYNYYSVCGDGLDRDVLMPYFSQPIAEFALRTPTYVFVNDGFDRALERSTFADVIPARIAQRVNKGGYALGQLETQQKHVHFLRDLVLGGEVMKQGWLDRAKTEHMLTQEHLVHGGGSTFIESIVVSEAWLQSWRNTGARAAA